MFEVPSPNDLKLRHIIAGLACKTRHPIKFIDLILKASFKNIKCYIRNGVKMLKQLPKLVNERTLLVYFDVVNLYSNLLDTLEIETFQVRKQCI